MNWNRKQARLRARIVETAKSQVGYRAQPGRQSWYTPRHLNGKSWNGAFVDWVLREAEANEVSFLSTATALRYYLQENRLYLKNIRPGDVVFYAFSTDPASPLEQPHIGIVTEVLPNGVFRAVEGETSPGVPQGSQLPDGVFERERHISDTVGIARIKPPRSRHVEKSEPETVRMSYITSNPQTKARAVANIQTALNRATGGVFNRGKFDRETKSQLGAYARERGLVSNRGEADYQTLNTLADETGMLDIEP